MQVPRATMRMPSLLSWTPVDSWTVCSITYIKTYDNCGIVISSSKRGNGEWNSLAALTPEWLRTLDHNRQR
jgi:hypothetical protein